ncbi:MAG: 1-deoxy-D-xylulose-5-phosphate reductoisomerase [Treponema sp.]|jgi:1-deoxy-D-xylulose-5-phosphate reductoisomerase|nr:1-deoxy-D-xylulose-5-phosphate reductoisomerase [Treponema sp.]
MKKKLAVLGATGSIGKNTVDIIRQNPDDFEPVLFTGNTDREALLRLGREFPGVPLALSGGMGKAGVDGIAYYGKAGLLRAVAECGADIAVNGIAGSAGLEPSLAAIEAGCDVALANKETVVMAGPLVFERAGEKKVNILPVDSEHSAIFHLINAYGRENVDRVFLTASGGPFRTLSTEDLALVGVRDALAHPTWKMGAKISLDSATLANKGLEVIEACRLFNMEPEDITVLIHPQSIVHSMIRLRNNAVYAQLSQPDMRLPIQEALYRPETRPSPFGALDFRGLSLEFAEPDGERFPMLPLAYEAAKRGGLYPLVYNAANEIAAETFFREKIHFLDIARIVRYVMEKDWQGSCLNLETILKTDREARRIAFTLIGDI